MPERTKFVAPVYSRAMRAARAQGTTVLDITIGPDGTVTSASMVSSTNALLNDAALDGVRRWEYTQATLDGQPISVVARVTVIFTTPEPGKDVVETGFRLLGQSVR